MNVYWECRNIQLKVYFERNVKKSLQYSISICKFDTMKKICFVVLGIGILITSCQSEYGERMKKALQLKKEYQKLHIHLQKSNNPNLISQLSEIKKEIRFHATVSGNEQLFLKEIWNN